MRGHLMMSKKERERKVFLSKVVEGGSLVVAARQMQLSYRQAGRIWKRYQAEGDAGLLHQNRGRGSNRRYDEGIKKKILGRYQERYEGFGPTLAMEKLASEGYSCCTETLRLWLKKEGLWQPARRRSPHRQRRERRASFGALLQLDGSHHRWLGSDHPPCCLMNLVDDATGTTLSLLAAQETTQAAMELLLAWIERYGVPEALYVDLKTVYVSPNDLKADLSHQPGWTHFSKACYKLGIRIIKAYSPQAKGRVERNHAVYQDRFVKELALQGIHEIGQANEVLNNGFIDGLNTRFAKAAVGSDIHRAKEAYGDLQQSLCWEYSRQVQNDWTFRFEGAHYQLARSTARHIKAGQELIIRKHLKGSLSCWYKGQRLLFQRIASPAEAQPRALKGYSSVQQKINGQEGKKRSPWRHWNPDWLTPASSSVVSTSAGADSLSLKEG